MKLMFTGECLAAVVDFRPPDPFFIADELGRIAYASQTAVGSAQWQADASALIAAYQDANPDVPPGTAYSARIALARLPDLEEALHA